MPGISLVYNQNKLINTLVPTIDLAVNQLIHNEQYFRRDLLKTKQLFVTSTKYENYPVDFLHNYEIKIVLEGKVYNKSVENLGRELESLTNYVDNKSVLKKSVLKFITETDGDYLLLIYDSLKDKVIIFNDYLARLPLYYVSWNNNLILSREVGFLSKIVSSKDYDKVGIAQSLLFGYPIAERTFINNFKRVFPMSLFTIDLKLGIWEYDRLDDFNFEVKNSSFANLEKSSDELIELLSQSCKSRFDPELKNVLSLSGGLDSRAVGISYKKNKLDFISATYIGYQEFSKKDAAVAKEVAGKLEIDWELINVGIPKGNDIAKLLKFKGGLNSISFAFLMSYYEQLIQKFGKGMVFITGDGGDKIFPNHLPSQNISNPRSLVDYLISNKYYFSPSRIEKLLGITKKDLVEEILAIMIGYPENDMKSKFERFVIVERGIKWLFEGEDRNRYLFWNLAPFYSLHMFNYAMNIPNELKANYKLYNNFLAKLSPQLSLIKNPLWNVPNDSSDIRFRTINFMKSSVFPLLPAPIKRRLRMRINKTSQINLTDYKKIDELMEKLTENKIISDYFSVKELRRTKVMSKEEFYNLLSVLLAIDSIESSESILGSFYNQEFI